MRVTVDVVPAADPLEAIGALQFGPTGAEEQSDRRRPPHETEPAGAHTMTDDTRRTRATRRARSGRTALLAATLAVASSVLSVASPSTTAAGPAPASPVRDDIASEEVRDQAVDVALAHLGAPPTPSAAPPEGSNSKPGGPATGPELRVTSTATSVDGDVTHVYVQQSHAGIDIVGANANVAVVDGAVVHSPARLPDPRSIAGLDLDRSAEPALDEIEAVAAAADALGLVLDSPPTLVERAVADGAPSTIEAAAISNSRIPVRNVWAPVGKDLRLAWEVVIDVAGSPEWWELLIDAETGDELDRFDYNIDHTFHAAHETDTTIHRYDVPDGHGQDVGAIVAAGPRPPAARSSIDGRSSYRVFPPGTESPLDGPRVLVVDPADDVASPFGWHDTDGVAGAESTLTIGNNVDAFTDGDRDDAPDPGSRPDGGAALTFDFPFDPEVEPAAQSEAAVTQLFVSTNYAHDYLHAYGFDEASGNFQTDNHGRGGRAGDAVLAEAHGTEYTGNANFATPPDGSAPRMQNFFWNGGSGRVDLDGVYDQGVVLHEYGHGLSVRLTGGRTTSSCLRNREQAGEGWSDYVALMATMDADDTGRAPRGVGNYVTRRAADGRGIRARPYSTDSGVDPRTYGDIASSSVPHGVGSIWTALLWEMTWDMIDEYGLDPDLVHGDGGNNLAMQLVVDGLKLQPCNPGFVDARDAIIQADRNLTDGANTCLIWESFARRGLGAGAAQGSTDDHTDGIEAFDVPASCPLGVTLTTESTSDSDDALIDVVVGVDNNSLDVQRDIALTVPLAGLTPTAGSATCGGVVVDGELRMRVDTLAPNDTATCSFRAEATAGSASTVLDDDFDDGASRWRPGAPSSTDSTWVISTGTGRNGSKAAYATGGHTGDDQSADLRFTLDDPVTVPAGGRLEFWHRHDFEAGYDGGVVEISVDGGTTWTDLGADLVVGGYTGGISGTDRSAIAGRSAFTGTSTGFSRSIVDLCRFSGEPASFRFRSVTDPGVESGGWWVDDVTVAAGPSIRIAVTAVTSSAASDTDGACIDVAPDPSTSGTTTTTSTTTTGPITQDSPDRPAARVLAGNARAERSAERMGRPAG